MVTPYDWQEGIGNRAQYIEGKLATGSPVLAISIPEGILVVTYRRQTKKVYEIYDRLLFAAIGQQSDVEAVRIAALEFASREGYNRSEQDVTIQRVATGMTAPLKKGFSDFGVAPLVVRCLFAEVGPTPEEDRYFVLDYDGDYAVSRKKAVVAGTLEVGADLEAKLDGLESVSPENAFAKLKEIWRTGVDPENHKTDDEIFATLKPEALLLERSDLRENRFRSLTPEDF
jgi:proteasome alpha subunit